MIVDSNRFERFSWINHPLIDYPGDGNCAFYFFGMITVLILIGAIFLMLQIDNAQNDGTRNYIAIAALVLLGAVDSQIGRFIKRRIRFSLTTTPEEQRFGIVSLLLMFVFAVVLFDLALLLPSG